MSSVEPSRILLVEDDTEILSFIETELRFEGHQVSVAHDGYQGLKQARQENFDLILLDRMLPGLDGLSLCRRLRQTSDMPIMMLTARGELHERLEGLDAGANDYIVKPFELEELLARIRVQLRQRQPRVRSHFDYEDLRLDTASHEVYRGETEIALTPTEFLLLHLFMQHPGEVLARKRILEAVWGWDFEGEDNVLEVYIRYLRKKIDLEGLPRLIQTVRGIGYVLRKPAAA